ncbi:MAG: 50S ribosomal protein L6 [Candidatus Berkelbacteria bacterium Athens1014_28]|uniref:50S ribosomal protein L6 n=1 Tax=Candidatus Berkelbacteria bacterium Athens1014_28 TaxID=2017145 RepID=A0A554LQZ0_9BACT|nr:MAG: 50S ribosomal protein L6 [Candidatus Berkelbacteria bacterium Athens1014_28]
MSRIGKKLINIPEGISVSENAGLVLVKKAEIEKKFLLPEKISLDISDSGILVKRSDDSKIARSLHGTANRIIANMIQGIEHGFEKKLSYKGVGFTVAVNDNRLSMRLGYSHLVEIEIPKNINLKIEKNIIRIFGSDKNAVGDFAADVRDLKKPEVYKGKGIKYSDEVIRKKAGKTAQSA